ncbi:MAG TPA: hypothetical protein VKJ65_04660 [Phycisphaerae bacterium]|nr:hypothetical protein [Phycisphaerae bacterium]
MEMKMTIKFSDETIKEARKAWSNNYDPNGSMGHWCAAAAVFEAAANAQVEGNNTISGMTDGDLANELWNAFGIATNDKEGWLTAAVRARELLQPSVNGSLTVQSEYKIRAERAEAAIERARSCVESGLRMTALNDFQRGFDEALKTICTVAGFTITPARELAVTWNARMDIEAGKIAGEIDSLFSEGEGN